MFKFKKNSVVGISISPELGLEVAEVDYLEKRVCKYARAPLAYDYVQKNIADLDIFKETLQDLLANLEIPKGSDIVLNMPPVAFDITEYPASLTNEQVEIAIEENLASLPIFSFCNHSRKAVKVPSNGF